MDARASPSPAPAEIHPTTGVEGIGRSWRAEVLDVWLTVGAFVFPATVVAAIALRRAPRFDASAAVLIVLAMLIVVLQRAHRMRFELRALATIIVFASPLLWLARSGFALGGGAILITAILLTTLLFGQRYAFALLLVTAGGLLGVGWVATHNPDAMRFDDSDPRVFMNWVRMTLSVSVVTGALVAAIALVVRRIEQKRIEVASVLARLTASEQALRTAYDQLGRLHGTVMLAQEEERRRIARELHDQLGQMLTALKLKLGLRRKPGADSAIEAETIAIVDWLLDRTRRLSLDLRPPLLEDQGLIAALEVYLREQQAISGVELTLRAPEIKVGDLTPELQVMCFRIVQESVTNTLRHAAARRADVSLVRAPAGLEIAVHDDGDGFVPEVTLSGVAAQGHFGLIGVRERAHAVGGTFAIESSPGAGTTVRVSLPLLQRPDAAAAQRVSASAA